MMPVTAQETGVAAALPRLRHCVAWSLLGNVAYALSQWVVLAVVSKAGGAQMVGQLALALAITSPVFLFTSLQLSTVQTTDAADQFGFSDYFSLRLISTVIGLLLVVLSLQIWRQSATTAAVVLIIACSKGVDSVSDVIYGFLRRHERMGLIALSQIIKGLVSVIAVILVLEFGAGLTWAAWGLMVAGSVTLAVCDFPMLGRVARATGTPVRLRPRCSSRNAIRLARLTLPLGFSAMIVSFNANVPRYFIGRLLGEESLGFFAGTAYMTMAGTFVVSAVAQAVLPRLAHYYNAGDLDSLKAVLFRLSALAIGVGAAGILLSIVAGREILAVLYRPEYAPYSMLLTLLACAATIGYEASVLNAAMNAVRRFGEQTPLFIATTMATSMACFLLIPGHSLNGAALAIAAGYGLQLAGAVGIVTNALRMRRCT